MIRTAEEKDILAIMDIYNEAVINSTASFDLEAVDYKNRKEWFDAHTDGYILAVYEEDGEILGYCCLSQYNSKEAYRGMAEVSVYVKKDFRGRHIGERLLAYLIEYAKQTEMFHTLLSLITSENTVSIRLHQKLGFEHCGKIRHAGIKFNRILDVDMYEYIL